MNISDPASMTETIDVAGRLGAVKERIAAAARHAGRDAAAVELVAVSKAHAPDRIRPALDAGCRAFGENRVQEAAAKWPPLRAGRSGVRLHLIGRLQTNKAALAADIFDVIETVDRPKLARALAAAFAKTRRRPTCLIQVNTGAEPQKAGVGTDELDAFVGLCRDELRLPVAGLMCIPPVDEAPAMHFAFLAALAKRNGLGSLSMGMTNDFETAVAFGATSVRVGRAVFGPRPLNLPPAG